MDRITPIIAWAAPIASTLIITWLTALINGWVSESKKDKERDESERKAWRAGVDQKLKDQDGKIDAVLQAQCSQIRSDILHKAHRYIDDLGCASTEEKKALWAEYEDYMSICDANNISNHFIDSLANQVMELPNRPPKA